jgi:uncharacterized membrane protein
LPGLPDPLHPALVHLPLSLALLVPFAALATLIAVRRGALPARGWMVVVVLQALLVGSAWVALESGEDEEERVERVVPHERIHEHHDAAEWFLVLSGLALGAAAIGLAGGGLGSAARAATLLLGALTLAAALRTGLLGGALVYEHGAASAYTLPLDEPAQSPTD